jgi:hypothetical protein
MVNLCGIGLVVVSLKTQVVKHLQEQLNIWLNWISRLCVLEYFYIQNYDGPHSSTPMRAETVYMHCATMTIATRQRSLAMLGFLGDFVR